MNVLLKLAFLLITATSLAADPQTNAVETPKKSDKPAADWGAFFRMHYENRVRAFKEQNLGWQHVVLLGDSITEGFDVTKHFPGRQVLNRGIGADIIGNALPPEDPRGLLRRLDNSVFDCAATDVFLLIGINDLGAGRSVDVMEQGYRELVKKIREGAPKIRLHIQSVLPTRDKFAKHNAPVLDFNERLRKIATEQGCNFIDLHKLMVDEKGELKAEITNDGLHLTDPAYVLWRAEILKTMKWQ